MFYLSFLLVFQADLQIPRGPVSVATSDQPVRAGAASRMMFFTAAKSGLLSLKASEFTNRDLIISKLPTNAKVGARSLFYMKDDVSTEFIFTNESRTTLYYADNSSTYPLVSTKTCGPFVEISDIHITEVSSAASRIIVLDKGAAKVYSYAITPSGSSLCSSGVSMDMESPLWVQSLTAATPTLFIGNKTADGLEIGSYNSTTLANITDPTSNVDAALGSYSSNYASYTSSAKLTIAGSISNPSTGKIFTNYLQWQMGIGSTAAAGVMTAETATYEYLES
jgi:hypothetical protein